MKIMTITLSLALVGLSSVAHADPTPTPMNTVKLGKNFYQQSNVQDFIALLTDVQAQLDPKLVPGWYDPSPIDQIRMQVLPPIDINLFAPKLKFPGDLSIPDPKSPCELFAETWDDPEAVQCACEVFSELSSHNYYQALAQATFAGNRVASGGACWPPVYDN